MSNKFTSKNQSEQLAILRKSNENGWTIIVEKLNTYFLYVFLQKESEYKYIIYTYDIDAEQIYIQDSKTGGVIDFLFYFCNLCIDKMY